MRPIRFLWRNETVSINHFDPTQTLLDWLRIERRLIGTKEGCNEGDCGACTVAVCSLKNGKLVVEAVNACILLPGQLDGRMLITIEDLAEGGVLHPVQEAFVRHHASQCGFCTPGFVMSLFVMTHAHDGVPTKADVDDWVAGNLCRCTGYRPITDAGLALSDEQPDWLSRSRAEIIARLEALADQEDVLVGDDNQFFAAPATQGSLLALLDKHRDATILAGATDIGLWITKRLDHLPKLVHLGRVVSLSGMVSTAETLTLSAGVTYAESAAEFESIDPDLGEVWRRIGSKQVRASGTVCGNVANGSPIGDTPPILLALGTEVELATASGVRVMPLEDFHISYGKQNRARHEVLTRLIVSRPRSHEHVRAYKISKRFDQDISAVMAAFKLGVENGIITSARIAYGGMAATPKRARAVENALLGARPDDPATHQKALQAYAIDFQPIDDMRASASYRQKVAANLLVKALAEIARGTSSATRLTGIREARHASAS